MHSPPHNLARSGLLHDPAWRVTTTTFFRLSREGRAHEERRWRSSGALPTPPSGRFLAHPLHEAPPSSQVLGTQVQVARGGLDERNRLPLRVRGHGVGQEVYVRDGAGEGDRRFGQQSGQREEAATCKRLRLGGGLRVGSEDKHRAGADLSLEVGKLARTQGRRGRGTGYAQARNESGGVVSGGPGLTMTLPQGISQPSTSGSDVAATNSRLTLRRISDKIGPSNNLTVLVRAAPPAGKGRNLSPMTTNLRITTHMARVVAAAPHARICSSFPARSSPVPVMPRSARNSHTMIIVYGIDDRIAVSTLSRASTKGYLSVHQSCCGKIICPTILGNAINFPCFDVAPPPLSLYTSNMPHSPPQTPLHRTRGPNKVKCTPIKQAKAMIFHKDMHLTLNQICQNGFLWTKDWMHTMYLGVASLCPIFLGHTVRKEEKLMAFPNMVGQMILPQLGASLSRRDTLSQYTAHMRDILEQERVCGWWDRRMSARAKLAAFADSQRRIPIKRPPEV
ncbi:hypothetical protein B0H15DRAFT_803430 [Mycena belliarum]|uniref:Uncharacterized protein n=1 Tax=Mycena belliarum TaxID=1033014 RepID=A0AAD6TXT5_9AGAR|nr:hypothetical protein B0H15DRAFT_803430 [Mycena belliae]